MDFGSHDGSNSLTDSPDQPFPLPPLPPSPFAAYTTEALINQEHLKSLVEGLTAIDGGWTYAISWHPSHDDDDSGSPLLTWGGGHYINNHQHDHQEDIVTDTEWFFLVSMTQSFSTNALLFPARAFFSGAEQHLSSGMMCERAWQGEVFGLHTLVFVPVANWVLELGSTQLTFQNSDIIDEVIGLINRIWAPWFPYIGFVVHRRQLIRWSLNAERLVERGRKKREDYGHIHDGLRRLLAGKEKICEQILECPWPLLTGSSDGDSDGTSYSDSNGFSGPS